MFDCTLQNLTREVRAGESETVRNLKSRKKMLQRFRGPSGMPEVASEHSDPDPDLENQAVSWLLLFKAHVAHHRPTAKVTTARMGPARIDAKAQNDALKRWITETNFRKVMDEGSDDYGFNHTVVMTRRTPRANMMNHSAPLYFPECSILNPEEVSWDVNATDIDRARIIWRRYARDIADCFDEAEEDKGKPKWEQEGWNIEALEKLTVDNELHHLVRPTKDDTTVRRHEVVFRDVYVAEYELPWVTERFEAIGETAQENGFNGTIFTLAMSTETDDELQLEESMAATGEMDKKRNEAIERLIERQAVQFPKEARPFFGPPGGFLRVIGAHNVPGQAAPAGHLAVNEAGVAALNRADRLLTNRMEKRKNIVAYDSRDQQTAAAIKDADDQDYVGIPHLGEEGSKLQQLTLGGYDQQDVHFRDDRREILHRNLGMSDAMQGQGSGNVTATADSISAQSAGARMEVLASKFLRGFEDVLKDVLWYIWHDPDYVTVIGEGEESQLWIGGKPTEDRLDTIFDEYPEFEPETEEEFDELLAHLQETRGTFADLELEIVLSSTQRETAQAKVQKAGLANELLANIVSQAPALEGWFDLQGHLDNVCADLDIEWFAKLYNAQGAQAAAQLEGVEHPNQLPKIRGQFSPTGIAASKRHSLMTGSSPRQAAPAAAPSGPSAGQNAQVNSQQNAPVAV